MYCFCKTTLLAKSHVRYSAIPYFGTFKAIINQSECRVLAVKSV